MTLSSEEYFQVDPPSSYKSFEAPCLLPMIYIDLVIVFCKVKFGKILDIILSDFHRSLYFD